MSNVINLMPKLKRKQKKVDKTSTELFKVMKGSVARITKEFLSQTKASEQASMETAYFFAKMVGMVSGYVHKQFGKDGIKTQALIDRIEFYRKKIREES